jgi:hypothetical protein
VGRVCTRSVWKSTGAAIRAWVYDLRKHDAALGIRPIWTVQLREVRYSQRAERFVKVLAGYTMMSNAELGLNTFIKRDGNGKYIVTRDVRISLEDKPILRLLSRVD